MNSRVLSSASSLYPLDTEATFKNVFRHYTTTAAPSKHE